MRPAGLASSRPVLGQSVRCRSLVSKLVRGRRGRGRGHIAAFWCDACAAARRASRASSSGFGERSRAP